MIKGDCILLTRRYTGNVKVEGLTGSSGTNTEQVFCWAVCSVTWLENRTLHKTLQPKVSFIFSFKIGFINLSRWFKLRFWRCSVLLSDTSIWVSALSSVLSFMSLWSEPRSVFKGFGIILLCTHSQMSHCSPELDWGLRAFGKQTWFWIHLLFPFYKCYLPVNHAMQSTH